MSVSPTSPSARAWTVLLYSAADNNLRPWMEHDVAEMEQVGSNEQTQLLVQIDHGRAGGGCQRLALRSDAEQGGHPDTIDTPPAQDLGQVNMSAPQTLADALVWAMETYPAEHTMLIISDHGNAWHGCCQDESHLGWMNLPALRSALHTASERTGRTLDVLGFDACLMANTEVAYQLKDEARYLVASEQTEGAEGWPYTPILGPDTLEALQARLSKRLDLTPAEMARMLVARSADDQEVIHTLSAIDLQQMEPLKEALVELRAAILGAGLTQEHLRDLLGQTQRFFGYRDLGHWLSLLAADARLTDGRLNEAVVAAQAAYQQAVVAEQHAPSAPNATGLTIHLTRPNDPLGYQALDFQKATDWMAVGNLTGPA